MKSPFNSSSNYSILNDDYMIGKGFKPLSIEEKLKFLSLWIREAKQKKAKFISQLNTANYKGIEPLTDEERELVKEDSEVTIEKIKEILYNSNISTLKNKIKRQEEVLEKLQAEFQYWKHQKDYGNQDNLNKSDKTLNQNETTTREFFEQVRSGKITGLDTYSKVQELTDNFDETKLNLLCKDYDFYVFILYEEWLASFTDEEIEKKIHEWQKEDRKLPYAGDKKPHINLLYVDDFFKKEKYGEPISDEKYEKLLKNVVGTKDDSKSHKLLDTGRLFGGFYFSHENILLHELKEILVKAKRKHTSAVYKFDEKPADLQANNNYINWVKKDDTLKQFIEELIDQNLIEQREPQDIIKDHFEPSSKPNKEPKPIIWLDTIALLAYMIESLDQQYIKPKHLWNDTAFHFLVEGKTPQNMKQIANGFKRNKSGKPKNYNIVDNIISDLKS